MTKCCYPSETKWTLRERVRATCDWGTRDVRGAADKAAQVI